jgi:hypothetical protein
VLAFCRSSGAMKTDHHYPRKSRSHRHGDQLFESSEFSKGGVLRHSAWSRCEAYPKPPQPPEFVRPWSQFPFPSISIIAASLKLSPSDLNVERDELCSLA